MMKHPLSLMLSLALTLMNAPIFGHNAHDLKYEYEGNEGYECDPFSPYEQHIKDDQSLPALPMKQDRSSPCRSKIHASMIGWGIGLCVGIALLSGLVHQSKEITPPQPLKPPHTPKK